MTQIKKQFHSLSISFKKLRHVAIDFVYKYFIDLFPEKFKIFQSGRSTGSSNGMLDSQMLSLSLVVYVPVAHN